MLLQRQTSSVHGDLTSAVHGDFVAVAVSRGHVEVSLDLGKQRPTDVRLLQSTVNVSDGNWHTLSFARFATLFIFGLMTWLSVHANGQLIGGASENFCLSGALQTRFD